MLMRSSRPIRLLLVLPCLLLFLVNPVLGESLVLTPTPEATAEPVTAPDAPVIESLTLLGKKEYAGVRANLRGKRLLPAKGSVSVTMTDVNGSPLSVKDFHLQSDTLLTFDLPATVGSGNVTVTATNERGGKSTSKPYYFEFHQPEILFVTGDEGIGPGKKIKIWGKHFDGTYYRDHQRALYAPIMNGKLEGADKKMDGNLSVIEITLPEGSFKKEFWVERNCDDQGENCLKSNKIVFSSSIPPLLTEIQADYQQRTATIFGKNFPEDKKDFSVRFGSSGATVLSYEPAINKAVIEMPCPLKPSAEVTVTANGVKSNTVVFVAKDTPQILNITSQGSRVGPNRDLEVALNPPRDLPATSACTDFDNTLTIGSKKFPLKYFGGLHVVQNILFKDIPESGDATVVLNGVESPSVPFSKETFDLLPHIYSIESKYGFRPGVPFVITGRNFIGDYKACDRGEVKVNGVDIHEEQMLPVFFGYDEDEEEIIKDVCHRIPPTVAAGRIDAQFSGVTAKGATQSKLAEVTVTVGSKKSNAVKIPFGTADAKSVMAGPEIRSVSYPNGHNAGDEIIIYGSNFSPKTGQNAVLFGAHRQEPLFVNIRGTEMRAVIPENPATTLTVERLLPDKQVSESFPVMVTNHPAEELSFALAKDLPATIDASEAKALSLATYRFINSIGNLKVSTLRMTIAWQDLDPQYAYSLTQLKIPPFDPFTLTIKGKKVAGPVNAVIVKDGLSVSFPPFVLPLTDKSGGELSVESQLMRFAQPGSRFSLEFDPTAERNFLATDLNRQKGVRPKESEPIKTGVGEIIGKDFNRCIDTDAANIHCQHFYDETASHAVSSTPSVAPVPAAPDLARQKKVQALLAEQKLKAEKNARLTGRQRVLALIREKAGDAAAARAEAALAEADRKALDALGSAIEQKNAAKREVLQKESLAQAQARQQALAEALIQKVAAAERLLKSRLDRDHDGLTDAEEELLGTDPLKSDTDEDGYSDFLEIEFGYSPTHRKAEFLFSDLPDAGGAAGTIARLTAFGVLSGYADGSFKPLGEASRAQFVSGIVRIFQGKNLPAAANAPFADVQAEDWFAPEVVFAKSSGFLPEEEKANAFRPYEAITRLDACRLVFQAAGAKVAVRPLLRFRDVAEDKAGLAEACITAGLLPSVMLDLPPEPTPTPSPTASASPAASPTAKPTPVADLFGPDRKLTRAEMATMILRSLRLR